MTFAIVVQESHQRPGYRWAFRYTMSPCGVRGSIQMRAYMWTGVSFIGVGLLVTGFLWIASQDQAVAHCQVPCGIYDDGARIARLHEDATTIAKAIRWINELAADRDAQSLNQATRWIVAKEDHASHIIEVVAEYFLAQRVKPVAAGGEGYDGYLKQLADHHAAIVAAMKAKQNTDPKVAETLHRAIDVLATHYPE